MAIYHLTVKTVSRTHGQSAAAKARYVLRAGRYAGGRSEVVMWEQGNMPLWVRNRLDYWEAADIYERANGRLLKEVEFALPVELDESAQADLVRRFVARLVEVEEGRLPYLWAIHRGGGRNPHCHLLISERVHDGLDRSRETWFRRYNGADPAGGGAPKTDALKRKEWLLRVREMWAEMANEALERAGVEARIDHRTLEAQGVDRIPEIHLGPVLWMGRKGIPTERADWYREVNRANEQLRLTQEELERVERQIKTLLEEAEMVRTLRAMRRQLRAMGCDRVEVGVYDRQKGQMVQRELSAEELLTEKMVRWLRHRNAVGCDIYVRPARTQDHGLILLDDLDAFALGRLKEHGLQPAAVVETSPGNFQAWIRFKHRLSPDVRSAVARRLAELVWADPASADAFHYGRLAGFTNRKPERARAGRPPFVLIHEWGGHVLDDHVAMRVLREARERLSQRRQRLSQRISPPQGPMVSPDVVEAYGREIERLMSQFDDLSVCDLRAAMRLLARGYAAWEVAGAMRVASPHIERRKRGHVEDYIARTIARAEEYLRQRNRGPDLER
jgi:hypothetical protein